MMRYGCRRYLKLERDAGSIGGRHGLNQTQTFIIPSALGHGGNQAQMALVLGGDGTASHSSEGGIWAKLDDDHGLVAVCQRAQAVVEPHGLPHVLGPVLRVWGDAEGAAGGERDEAGLARRRGPDAHTGLTHGVQRAIHRGGVEGVGYAQLGEAQRPVRELGVQGGEASQAARDGHAGWAVDAGDLERRGAVDGREQLLDGLLAVVHHRHAALAG